MMNVVAKPHPTKLVEEVDWQGCWARLLGNLRYFMVGYIPDGIDCESVKIVKINFEDLVSALCRCRFTSIRKS